MKTKLEILRSLVALLIVVAIVAVIRYGQKTFVVPSAELSGLTMGTSWQVKIPHWEKSRGELQNLEEDIDQLLEDINWSMSTWIPESDLSKWNRSRRLDPIEVDPDLLQVVRFALAVARASGGAFDPTVDPLVNLWGFGPEGRPLQPPSEDMIKKIRSHVGYTNVVIIGNRLLGKKDPWVEIDLGAVAKGYGVDVLMELITSYGIKDALVEIGGETSAIGMNQAGHPWRIGVQRPVHAAIPGQELQGILEISGMAVATSGDYQNFYKDEQGDFRTHIIDPRTGSPVHHSLAGVTVISTNCMTADALATALYVLGPEKGNKLVKQFKNTEAYYIERMPDGSFREIMSEEFKNMAGYSAWDLQTNIPDESTSE